MNQQIPKNYCVCYDVGFEVVYRNESIHSSGHLFKNIHFNYPVFPPRLVHNYLKNLRLMVDFDQHD